MHSKSHVINPLDEPGWDETVAARDGASFFHSRAWAQVLSGAYGYQPQYFAPSAPGDDAAIVPMMEIDSRLTGRRGVSLPFTDSCPPLYDDPDSLVTMLGKVQEWGRQRGWRYAEFRSGDGFEGETPSACYLGHVIDLAVDEQALLDRCSSAVRRAIRKAQRSDLRVDLERSESALREFVRLNRLTRREHGLPPQPQEFFRGLYRHVLEPGKGWVALARLGRKAVAGAVFLHFGQSAMFKYGASDARYRSLRPNNLVIWEAVCRYARQGYRCLSLGRTRPQNEGLLHFKRGWGADEQQIRYFRYDFGQQAFVSAGNGLAGWQNTAFRRMPAVCCRAIGAVLYRHVG